MAAAIFLVATVATVGSSGEKPTVLMTARGETAPQIVGIYGLQLEIQREEIPMLHKLNNAGYAVVIASESGAKIMAGQAELNVDKKLSDVEVQDYVGVIVPCMGEVAGAIPQKAVQIIQNAYRRNLPIAAQMSGVMILGAAGVLQGKNFTIGEGWEYYIKGGTFKGIGVVQDGNTVTSGTCPYLAAMSSLKDGTDELMTTFIGLLKK